MWTSIWYWSWSSKPLILERLQRVSSLSPTSVKFSFWRDEDSDWAVDMKGWGYFKMNWNLHHPLFWVQPCLKCMESIRESQSFFFFLNLLFYGMFNYMYFQFSNYILDRRPTHVCELFLLPRGQMHTLLPNNIWCQIHIVILILHFLTWDSRCEKCPHLSPCLEHARYPKTGLSNLTITL